MADSAADAKTKPETRTTAGDSNASKQPHAAAVVGALRREPPKAAKCDDRKESRRGEAGGTRTAFGDREVDGQVVGGWRPRTLSPYLSVPTVSDGAYALVPGANLVSGSPTRPPFAPCMRPPLAPRMTPHDSDTLCGIGALVNDLAVASLW